MRTLPLAALLFAVSLQAAQPDPLWDGHESVAAYAQRARLEPTKTLDLGNGVTLNLVLIPAGRFIMGTPVPEKPTISVFSAQVPIGVGSALALALLVYLLRRRRAGRRFSFSLRWLMAFSVACSVIVWGGTRWHLALVQNREYDVAMEQHPPNEKQHPVLISKAFYMGKYPVTQAQYMAVIGQNPSDFKGAQHPVEKVLWDDATVFCTKLNERFRNETLKARLPTEAQWEYACRAGTKTRFYSGDHNTDLDAVAWHNLNSRVRHIRLAERHPTHLAYTICTETSGNGVRICIGMTMKS